MTKLVCAIDHNTTSRLKPKQQEQTQPV